MKKSVGIIIGGKSVEHEVSIITGLQILDNIDRDAYNPKIIYIDKNGDWQIGDCFNEINNFKLKQFDDAYKVIPGFKDNKMILYTHPEIKRGFFSKKHENYEIDIVIPAVHGTNSEDGTLHGIFQLNGVPCAFGSVLSSAVGMDKIIMKDVFKSNKLPVVEYVWFYRSSWQEKDKKNNILTEAEELGFPLIIKPANLGSSVGISKAKNIEDLEKCIDVACFYDRKIIIEKCIENVREINCAVIGYEENLIVSLCEEPIGWEDFLTYEDKYISKGKNLNSDKRKIPANIDEENTKKIQNYAKEAFKSIDCCGDARIDFLYDGNNIYVNEINTIPGSIAFYLWEGLGIEFKEVVTKIIEFAEIQQKQKNLNTVSYDIDLLNKLASSGKHK